MSYQQHDIGCTEDQLWKMCKKEGSIHVAYLPLPTLETLLTSHGSYTLLNLTTKDLLRDQNNLADSPFLIVTVAAIPRRRDA